MTKLTDDDDDHPYQSIAHHLIERNRRVLTETPPLVVAAVWHGIAEAIRAWRRIDDDRR